MYHSALYADLHGLDAFIPPENYCEWSQHTRSDGVFYLATNLAYTVSRLHRLGIVVGDFNPKNFMVDKRNGIVRAIDADGMQFKCGGDELRITALDDNYFNPNPNR